MDADRSRCTARTLGGEPCTRQARPGTARCHVHSGRELRRAERKLQKLTVPAVARLAQLLESQNEAISLKAVTTILDRTAGPVPRAVTVDTTGGGPALQIGFALGGLVQAPTTLTLGGPPPIDTPPPVEPES